MELVDIERGLPTFTQQFLCLPLEVRRDAWTWFSQLDQRNIESPGVRMLSGRDFTAACVCPWGAIVVRLDLESAKHMRSLRPTAERIPELLDDYSDERIAFTASFDAVEHFTNLIDNNVLTEEQIHQLMVPEDFQ